jgi:alkylresorcinol/alkylpyrone synthase
MIPHLLGVATAVPRHRMTQSDVMARVRRVFAHNSSEIERLMGIYGNAGIDSRYSCVPLEWYEQSHGWGEKNRLFLENAVDLLTRAAQQVLDQTGLSVEDIDGIVAVSTTGIATPSLDALVMERMGMRRNVWRLPVFGLGCAGGVLGLARAAAMAKASPKHKILYLVVELCSLTFRNSDQSKSNIVASALFGDGAAAAVVSCEGEGPEIAAWGEHCWPDSLDVMGWDVADDGLGVVFSRNIPALIRADLRDAAESFLSGHKLRLSDIANFVCHPGGAKVIDALEEAFGLAPGAMTLGRGVLREFGNMSAATVMFVLRRTLDAALGGRKLMSSLGPGFTAGFLVLENA